MKAFKVMLLAMLALGLMASPSWAAEETEEAAQVEEYEGESQWDSEAVSTEGLEEEEAPEPEQINE